MQHVDLEASLVLYLCLEDIAVKNYKRYFHQPLNLDRQNFKLTNILFYHTNAVGQFAKTKQKKPGVALVGALAL